MGKLKVVCPHTDQQREDAMFDLAVCPICQAEEIKRLKARNDDLLENLRLAQAENKVRPGRPPLLNTVVRWRRYLADNGTVISREGWRTEYAVGGKIITVFDDGSNEAETQFSVFAADGSELY